MGEQEREERVMEHQIWLQLPLPTPLGKTDKLKTRSTALFFVRFPDEGIYSTGSLVDTYGEIVPGGPIGYELLDDALAMAHALNGDVILKENDEALKWCTEKRFTLWVKVSTAEMGYVKQTALAARDTASIPVPVEGKKRESALQASTETIGGKLCP